MSPLAISLVAAVLAVAAVATAVALDRMREVEPRRPWWSYPFVWVGLSLGVTVLGAFLFPRLLGFAFVFLPLLWFRGAGRRPPRPSRPADGDR